MKRTLKQIAENIKVNFVRKGFNPSTEQTEFICLINNESFDYSCGLFACIPATKQIAIFGGRTKTINPLQELERAFNAPAVQNNYSSVYKKIQSGQCKAIKNWDNWAKDVWLRISALCDPTPYDLLSCLQSDAQAGNSSFEDFCSNYGYDTDSRKAFETFTACQNNATKLKRALGPVLFQEVMESDPD